MVAGGWGCVTPGCGFGGNGGPILATTGHGIWCMHLIPCSGLEGGITSGATALALGVIHVVGKVVGHGGGLHSKCCTFKQCTRMGSLFECMTFFKGLGGLRTARAQLSLFHQCFLPGAGARLDDSSECGPVGLFLACWGCGTCARWSCCLSGTSRR